MPTPQTLPGGGPVQSLLDHPAVHLDANERRETVWEFFGKHAKSPCADLGYGRAVCDFQEWEISSGRIAVDGSGSPWWRYVNGRMVLDIAAALRAARRPAGPAGDWWDYAKGAAASAQAAVWLAHQRSLHAALRAAAPLLAREPAAEQAFAAIVVDIVDRTAVSGGATDSLGLAQLTARYYPASYPIAEADLPPLEVLRQRTAERLREEDGSLIAGVGLDSHRWD
ncbi:MAG: hypothetical protein IT303_18165 [Dehalococcoidia bacterium]|nr:hypothetical protein [Dehalococcoidia bacterium]